MPTRTITGPIYRPNTNIPWAHTTVIFSLDTPFTVSGVTYPTETKRYPVSASGTFTANLAVPASGTATYTIRLPDDTSYTTYIPAGEMLTLAALIAAAIPQQPQNTTLELIQQYSADKHYRHVQSISSATWTVIHNLNKYPTIAVVDSARDVVVGNITYDSINQATITFSAAFGGEAFCN